MAFGGRDKKSPNEEILYDPLDLTMVEVMDKHGVKKSVSALNIGFMERRQYVLYKVLPTLVLPDIAKCPEADVQEWLERIGLFENDLKWLLRLPHNRFWSQVVYDEKLQVMLQSYLSRAPRAYELNTNAPEHILNRQKSVHKYVYLVFLRMSTFKESKKAHITPHIFGDIIYENFLFDIPRMMDVCVLYGFHNQPVLTRLLQNCFNYQTKYFEDLNNVVPTILDALRSMEEKLEFEGRSKRRLNQDETPLSSASSGELLEAVNFVTDASATLWSFLEVFPPACDAFYFRENALLKIPSFYELVIPQLEVQLLQRENWCEKSLEDTKVLEVIRKNISFSKTFLVKIFRSITAHCLIQPIIDISCDPSKSLNESSNHLENFVHVFTEVASRRMFITDYNELFPFKTELELFYEIGVTIDPASLSYINSSIDSTRNLAKLTKSLAGMENGDVVRKKPSIPPDSLHSIGASLASSDNLTNGASCTYGAVGATPAKPEEAEIASLVQMICDVFPALGLGFIEACLDYYNYEGEPVIDAILTETLPKQLADMDRKTEKIVPETHEESSSVLKERVSIFDYDEFDVYNRKDVDLSKIHKGKMNKTKNLYNEKSFDVIKALTLKFEEDLEIKAEKDESMMYEDEYDDTYDSHFVTLAEAQPENELMKVRPFVTPIALRAFKKGGNQNEDESEEEDKIEIEQAPENEEEGNRFGGNDFCVNPEILREQARKRWEAKSAHKRPDSAASNASSDQNMKHKDRHKSVIANHNRRKQSDYKRSKGMY